MKVDAEQLLNKNPRSTKLANIFPAQLPAVAFMIFSLSLCLLLSYELEMIVCIPE